MSAGGRLQNNVIAPVTCAACSGDFLGIILIGSHRRQFGRPFTSKVTTSSVAAKHCPAFVIRAKRKHGSKAAHDTGDTHAAFYRNRQIPHAVFQVFGMRPNDYSPHTRSQGLGCVAQCLTNRSLSAQKKIKPRNARNR